MHAPSNVQPIAAARTWRFLRAAQENFNRHLALLGSIFVEYRRATAAARRYEELSFHRDEADMRFDVPRRIFEEFYSRGQEN